MLWCQVILFVLAVQGEQPELRAARPPVVNDPQATALAFVASLVDEANLAQSACSLDHISCFRVLDQLLLKTLEKLVTQIVLAIPLEGRQFDK